MKSGMRDYYILKSLGATKRIIQVLILIQMMFLILITIPIGLASGYLLSSMVLDSLSEFTLNNTTKELLDSTKTFYLIAGIACCFIISIGIYLERGIRNMSVSSILTDHISLSKEVGIL
jgi:predicted lysophospholipase L1 biosynthesis ABC-type transport system permease subunit